MSRGHNAGQYHNLKEGNVSFDIVEVFRCLGTTITNPTAYENQLRARWCQGVLESFRCRF